MSNQLTANIRKDSLGYYVAIYSGTKLICFIQSSPSNVRYWSDLKALKNHLATHALYKNCTVVA